MKPFYELKLLLSFESAPEGLITISDLMKNYIQQDKNAEIFSGEHVSQILSAEENNMSSAYFMSFNQSSNQELHCHTGSRILFIFSKKDASAHIGIKPDELVEEKMQNNSMYVLRMNKGVYHQFAGDFVAISVHPSDTKVGATMGDETLFA